MTAGKAAYVKAQGQTREHHCHWPGCSRQVPPAMWGCRTHWFTLPAPIRTAIWRTYRPGQEINGTPDAAYLAAAKEAQAWIAARVEVERCRGEACPNLGDSDFPPCSMCPVAAARSGV